MQRAIVALPMPREHITQTWIEEFFDPIEDDIPDEMSQEARNRLAAYAAQKHGARSVESSPEVEAPTNEVWIEIKEMIMDSPNSTNDTEKALDLVHLHKIIDTDPFERDAFNERFRKYGWWLLDDNNIAVFVSGKAKRAHSPVTNLL